MVALVAFFFMREGAMGQVTCGAKAMRRDEGFKHKSRACVRAASRRVMSLQERSYQVQGILTGIA